MNSEMSLSIPDGSFFQAPSFSQMSPFVETKEAKEKLDKAIAEKFSYKMKFEQLQDEYKQTVKKLEVKDMQLSRLLESESQVTIDRTSLNDTSNDSFEISKLKDIIKNVQSENNALKTQIRVLVTKKETTTQGKTPTKTSLPSQQSMTSIMYDNAPEIDTANRADILVELENLSQENAELKTRNEKLEEENAKLSEENMQLLKESNAHDELFDKYNEANEIINTLQEKLKQSENNETTVSLKQKITELTAKYEEEFKAKESLELQLAKMDDDHAEQVKTFNNEKEKLLSNIKESEDKIKNNELTINKQSTEIDKLKEQINQMQQKLKESEKLLKEANDTNMSLSRNISLLQTPKKQTEGEEYKTKYTKAKEELSKRRGIIEKLTKEKSQLIQQLSQHDDNRHTLEKKIEELQLNLKKAEDKNKELQAKLNKQDKERNRESKISYDNLRKEMAALLEQNNKLTQLLIETNTRLLRSKENEHDKDEKATPEIIKTCFNYGTPKSTTPKRVMFQ